MGWVLPEMDRHIVEHVFAGSIPLQRAMSQREMQGWRVLHEQRHVVWCGHGSGAVLRLMLRGGEVSCPEVIEGEEARVVWSEYGVAPDERVRGRADEVLVRGEEVEGALDAFIPSWRDWALKGSPRRLRVAMGLSGVLEVSVRPRRGEVQIASYGWISGRRAFDLIEEEGRSVLDAPRVSFC